MVIEKIKKELSKFENKEDKIAFLKELLENIKEEELRKQILKLLNELIGEDKKERRMA